jgi:hypothetical protein
MDAPINELADGILSLGAAIPIGPPMVLHVSPLPGSNEREEFSYDHAVDIVQGDLAAARAFFLHNINVVNIIDCLDIAAFQTV